MPQMIINHEKVTKEAAEELIRLCPFSAIVLRGGMPAWKKEQCVMCLSCLHHCPKFAIQYENRTKKHGQYTNPNVK